VMGSFIGWLDRALNLDTWSPAHRKLAGAGVVILLLALSALCGFLIETALRQIAFGNLLIGLVASTLMAQRSLYQHVARVRAAFADGGLAEARHAVSMIVGRDPDQLDEAGVCRAAIESCAENFSDGVVAPVFWLALLGLPGLIAYKAINTADSMIGHLSPRYAAFGWAAARLDDLVNLIPARIAGLLVAVVAPVAGGTIATALWVMWCDATKHRSPNAGWPESAMAGALGVALAGPRRYGERIVDDVFLNAEARKEATPDDIGRALDLLIVVCLLQAAAYAALALVV
jgi:adenosylcobinamide-phosphate synthase